MPSIIPSYVYTSFAMAIVGTLLISTFSAFASSLKPNIEQEQLKNLLEWIAAESCELISTAISHNTTITLRLKMPPLIGNQRYWVRFSNDSSLAWVEGDFGTDPFETELCVFIPGIASVSGLYVGGSGSAVLECEVNGTITYLNISGG